MVEARATRGLTIAASVVALASALLSSACTHPPQGRQVINEVTFEGTKHVDEDDIQAKIATAPTQKFLGLFRGVVYDYEVYNPSMVERDLQRVERYYRARGYHGAQARAAQVTEVSDRHVRVHIVVEEGEPTLVGAVTFEGLEGLDGSTRRAIEAAARPMREGERLDEDVFAATEKAIERALSDRGHAYAMCDRRAQVDVITRKAALRFRVNPGPRNTLGVIRVEGLASLPEGPVRTALALKAGDTYSTRELDKARVAVLDLGAFASVEVVPDLGEEPHEGSVPIVVRVQPSTLRSVNVGGGAEVDVLRTDVHLTLGWEHKNFLGGFRNLSLTARPGIVLYPTRVPTFQLPTRYLPEIKTRAEFGQPGFLEARTRGVLRASFDISPVLLSTKVESDAVIVGYSDLRMSMGLERGFGPLFGSVSLNVQRSELFAYRGALDPRLGKVVIPYLDLLMQLDRRDDKLKPHKGFFLANDAQLAFGSLIGSASDVRVQPEARVYVPLSKRVTLAMRASVGFLFPLDYGETLLPGAVLDEGSVAKVVRDLQLLFFRAFFSGGPNSNRGYPLRGVGPHGLIAFVSPDLAAQSQRRGCDFGPLSYEDPRCQLPMGGLTLWEASLELRVALAGALHGVTFCDASDVSSGKTNIRPKYLHLSCGLGVRYDTPVGAVRADVALRVPRAQILGKPDSDVEGDPGKIAGLPLALSLGIGETF